MIAVSVVVTLLNEASSVGPLIESLLKGARRPDEMVFVDAGSHDGTQDIIRNFQKRFSEGNIRLIEAKGANIAKGRNIGIRAASHEIIAVTDGACYPGKNWLRLLSRPFEEDSTVEVVGGNFRPLLRTRFQHLVYPAVIRPLDTIRFSPSSRSIAFRKRLWEKVGGYPEWLHTAEDTVFNQRWHRLGARYVFCPDALVHREVVLSFIGLIRKAAYYARGEGEALVCVPLRVLPLLTFFSAAGFAVLGVRSSPAWFTGAGGLIALVVVYYLRKGYIGCDLRASLAMLLVLPVAHLVGGFAFLRGLLTRIWWWLTGYRPWTYEQSPVETRLLDS